MTFKDVYMYSCWLLTKLNVKNLIDSNIWSFWILFCIFFYLNYILTCIVQYLLFFGLATSPHNDTMHKPITRQVWHKAGASQGKFKFCQLALKRDQLHPYSRQKLLSRMVWELAEWRWNVLSMYAYIGDLRLKWFG